MQIKNDFFEKEKALQGLSCKITQHKQEQLLLNCYFAIDYTINICF